MFRLRQDSLCDPNIQSGGCREATDFRQGYLLTIGCSSQRPIFSPETIPILEDFPRVMEEESISAGCSLDLPNFRTQDAGLYLAIFPARLADNRRIKVTAKQEATAPEGRRGKEKNILWPCILP